MISQCINKKTMIVLGTDQYERVSNDSDLVNMPSLENTSDVKLIDEGDALVIKQYLSTHIRVDEMAFERENIFHTKVIMKRSIILLLMMEVLLLLLVQCLLVSCNCQLKSIQGLISYSS